MARKKVTRELAPLPSRRALEKAHHKTEALIDILRSVAVKNQQEQPLAFHSVRAVGAHFRVPVSTVSRAYQHLEQEVFSRAFADRRRFSRASASTGN